MSYFEDLQKGYENSNPEKDKKKDFEPTDEDKRLLEEQDIEKLSARSQLRLAYLKNKMEKVDEKKKQEPKPEPKPEEDKILEELENKMQTLRVSFEKMLEHEKFEGLDD